MQHECIPQAILGMDILCQAKSGMGKTAVFVLSVLQQIETDDKEEEATVKAVVLCHTRELAFQAWINSQHVSAHLAWLYGNAEQRVALNNKIVCQSTTTS